MDQPFFRNISYISGTFFTVADFNISHFLLRSNARVFREHMRLPYARKGFTAFCLSALPSIVKETYSQWGMNRKEAESVAGITRLDLAEKYPQR